MEELEEWRFIIGHEGQYQVSNKGRIRSIDREFIRSNGRVMKLKSKIMKLNITSEGYVGITLHLKGKNKSYRVHRLVAQAFISNKENKETVNHKDCNKQNNKVSNLEWNSVLENVRHARANNLYPSKVPNNRLEGEVLSPFRQLFYFKGLNEFCELMNLHASNFSKVLRGKRQSCKGWIKNRSIET